MKCNRCIAIIAAIFLIAATGLVTADVPPQAVPENQVFTIGSVVEGVGAVTEKTDTAWQVGDKGIDRLPAAVGTKDKKIRSGSIALATYSDFIMSNGGQIADVKSFSMDTNAKTEGLYNIETSKVLTYTSQNGSHLMGRESYVLDVAGNWSKGVDGIICVFSKAKSDIIPAFCSRVSASSKLMSITTAQIETQGRLAAVSNTAAPEALQYAISVVPDANSASGYADGIVSTTFTVQIMEGRTDGKIRGNPSVTKVDKQREGARTPSGEITKVYTAAYYSAAGTADPRADPNTGFYTDLTSDDYQLHGGFVNGVATQVLTDNVVNAMVAAGAPAGSAVTVYQSGMTLTPDTWYLIPVMEKVDQLGNIEAWTDSPNVVKDRIYDLQFYDRLAATLTFTDTATIAGGISNFNKDFNYKSGVACTTCR